MASSLRMDLAVSLMIVFLIETSVCRNVKGIGSIIHDSKLIDLVVISVVVCPCFSLMASSLRMDLAVTRMELFPLKRPYAIASKPFVASFMTPNSLIWLSFMS